MDKFANGLLVDVEKVTKRWAEQNRREIREANARADRRSAFAPSGRVTVVDAAYEAMEQAYLKASGGGTLPVKPRQIMYAARGHIQERTGKRLDDRYFCQVILPDYCALNSDSTEGWDVVWDGRGNLVEPHTNRQVALGTLEVREYLASGGSRYLVRERHGGWSTCGPDDRFGAVLFVEKEGFMPLFRAVRLLERYDLAIMSTKGLSTTAARQLVDHFVGEKQVPVFCVRDFDEAGFKIAGTLRQGTRRYSWRSGGAVDVGLRGEDAEAWRLEKEEVFYRGPGKRILTDREEIRAKIAPTLRGYGATPEEIETLLTRRVELNAFASDRLIEWIEGKLCEHGVGKVIPGPAVLLQAARGFARDLVAARHLRTLADRIAAEVDRLRLDDLGEGVAKALADTRELAWDDALKELVRQRLGVRDGGLVRSETSGGADSSSSKPRDGRRSGR
jgi:hypothetical protein